MPLAAQDRAPAPAPAPASAAAPSSTPANGPTNGPANGQVFTLADFARFAPRNALDMLEQVPGFSIRGSDEQRGLGQATGNVLFNGARPSTKADDIFTLLQRIPAGNVTRIEIVDGSTLNVPGLSGQVANIIFSSEGVKGQFSYAFQARPHNTNPLFTRGDISLSGRSGAIDYELSLNNADSGRGGADGVTLITDGAGNVIETRDDQATSSYDSPRLSGSIKWDGPGSSVANLNAQYQLIYDRYNERGLRQRTGQPDQIRTVRDRDNSWNYEIGGDYEFALAGGRFKAIGLRRFSHEPSSSTVVSRFSDGRPDTGDRFTQTGDLGETIARGEFRWNMLGGDWQIAGEAAFNKLDNVAALFTLAPDGEFDPVPFPDGNGGVSEDRYEGSLSFSRTLTPKLSMQILLAAEHSTIVQTGANGLSRTFLRPKGTFSLSWKPASDFDASIRLERRVQQLSFYDFLARAFLNDSNQNASNNDLRPRQDWSFEAELNKRLGAWGSTKLEFIYRKVEDRIEVIPVGNGEAIGNIDSAWAAAVVLTQTLNLDPAGIKGMKIEGFLVLQTSRLRDPFTGETRQWGGFRTIDTEVSLRHDVPDTDWAWGVEASYTKGQPNFRRNQTDRVWEGPVFADLFVEHKDIFGLTVTAQASNILGARSYRDRTVFTGLRGASPIAFIEDRDRRIGPIFTLSVKGNF